MDKRIIGYRPTWAEINLDNLAHNYAQVQGMISSEIKIMVTVKADAYGHGLIPVAKRLVALGVDYFGVASIDEGIRLRQARIKIPVLVLGMILNDDIGPLFKYNLIPTVCTIELARVLDKKARSLGETIKVHLKVDTGMSRIGVHHEDAFNFVKKVHQLKFINIEGLFTHFAFADMNMEFTNYQIELFYRLVKKLKSAGIYIPLVHAANSMGVVNFRRGHFNMVRPGLVIYGLCPKEGLKLNLKPVLSLMSRVVYFKKVPAGQGVSYGHTYITRKATNIATLPIGYGDGYPRNLSNRASVLIKGKRFKISGTVCMDQIMVDVGNLPLKIGTEVVLIGRQGNESISAEELARLAETISYEIVCGLGSRVPRVYILSGEIID